MSKLLREASTTEAIVTHFLLFAVKAIDGRFGEGYAIRNPHLVSVVFTQSMQAFCKEIAND